MVVTDGVTEAMNPEGEEFSEERLMDVLKSIVTYSASSIQNTIVTKVREFTRGRAQHDDITIVIVKVR